MQTRAGFWQHRNTIAALIIVALTSAVYWPAMNGGFIVDDDRLLWDNGTIKSSSGLRSIWFGRDVDDYWPLTNSSFWLEWRLWEGNPTGYHVTNLALHIAAALVLWAVLRKLAISGSFFAAVLFAIHPVNVESVAWISQRKNLVAMLFFLVAIFCYLKSTEPAKVPHVEQAFARRRPGIQAWYWLSLLAFVLAMLGKGSVATLPLVLLGIEWWQHSAINLRALWRSVPFFVVAAGLTAVNLWFQTNGAKLDIRNAGLMERVLGAGTIPWFYLSKAILPIDLAFVYPQWRIDIGGMGWLLTLSATCCVTAILFWKRQTPWGRNLLFAWGFFCVVLAPVFGLVDVKFMYYSLVADHYQHIAIIAVVTLAAAAWAVWHHNARGGRRLAAIASATTITALLAILTLERCRVFGDPRKLYEGSLKFNSGCWMLHNNLAILQEASGEMQQAIEHYDRAIQLNPDSYAAHNNLASLLFDAGDLSGSLHQARRAIELSVASAEPYNTLGLVEAKLKRTENAIAYYRHALELKPDFAAAHYNLSLALVEAGKPEEAIAEVQSAIELSPNNADAYANLAIAYSAVHRTKESLSAAEKALELARSTGRTAFVKQLEAWLAEHR